MEKTALIVGSNGLFGSHLKTRLNGDPEWRTFCCSRVGRDADAEAGATIGVDLTDSASTRNLDAALTQATHVFYVARFASPDPDRENEVNRRMLANLLAAVDARGDSVKHVQVIHGTKWYGCHLGPYKTPAREDDPRHVVPNFYYAQQDMLAERRQAARWSWTALRPHTICGAGTGYAHSLVPLLGAYASLCRHLGLPLIFPGSKACFESVSQVTDADLLADAAVWAATEPRCRNEPFNLVNADYFRWCHLWPRLADFFGLAAGPAQPFLLGDKAASLASTWDEIVRQHGLRPCRFDEIGNWSYFDRILRSDRDDMSATTKIRQFGFDRVVETEAMFLRQLTRLREDRIIH